MSFSFAPQQSTFQSPFQQSTPFQQQPQQSPFQFQLQPPQHQQQQSQSQQLYLFTADKTPATDGTKWADLHPDSQKVLLQIEERILEYRDESQRLDQCSGLYDSPIPNNGFEVDASSMAQELGGISIAMERHKATLKELMPAIKDMLRHTEVAVRSFMMLRPRFSLQNKAAATTPTAASQSSAVAITQPSGGSPTTSAMIPIIDFYSGLPKKPSPFVQQTVSRFDKYLAECCQWIEELEQLLVLENDNSNGRSSSLLQSLPKVMTNVHEFFVHVAAKVESIHQYIESMKTAYLDDQHRRGDGSNPFLEAERRETAKQEAAARRVHPTLHLPAVSQPTGQPAGQIANSSAAEPSTAASMPAVQSASAGSGPSLFSTPAVVSSTPSLFSSPVTTTPFASSSGAVPSQTSLFSSISASPFSSSSPLLMSTPASGVSTFATPFATGAATGSGSSFNTASKARAKSRPGRR